MEVNRNLWILLYFSREVASDFLFLCRHLLEFQNEAWSSSDQLKGGCVTPLTFPLAPLILGTWLCRKCILSFGGDCTTQRMACTNKFNETFWEKRMNTKTGAFVKGNLNISVSFNPSDRQWGHF